MLKYFYSFRKKIILYTWGDRVVFCTGEGNLRLHGRHAGSPLIAECRSFCVEMWGFPDMRRARTQHGTLIF